MRSSLPGLCDQVVDVAHWERLAYFRAMLDKHLDLVERRLLNEETIASHEKVFSLFEPHTEWIQKGKQRPNVELGHRLADRDRPAPVDPDYAVPVGEADVDQSVRGGGPLELRQRLHARRRPGVVELCPRW